MAVKRVCLGEDPLIPGRMIWVDPKGFLFHPPGCPICDKVKAAAKGVPYVPKEYDPRTMMEALRVDVLAMKRKSPDATQPPVDDGLAQAGFALVADG